MSRKVWNWIYFIGFMLPVIAYIGQYTAVALSDGSKPLFDVALWNSIKNITVDTKIVGLMPVTSVAKAIIGANSNILITYAPIGAVTCGADFVIWLSIIHIVIDLFMLLSRCLSRLFAKFGGAD